MPEHLLAVDPGGTTGLAWCSLNCLGMKLDNRFGNMVSLGQIEGTVSEQAAALGRGIVRLQARAVVSESSDHFLLRARSGTMRKHSLIPIKMAGAIGALVGIQNDRFFRAVKRGVVREQMVHENIWPMMLVEQTPSQAKSVVSNDVLGALGVTWANKNKERHQLDAARHLVLFLRRYSAVHAGGKSPFRVLIDEELDWDMKMREASLRATAKEKSDSEGEADR